MTHIVIDNEFQSMEDKKMGNREQRIEQYFLRIMPNLCGTPVIVRQVIRRKRVSGYIYRDGHVSGWNDGKIQVHLLEDTFTIGNISVFKEEADINLTPPEFFEAYDEYIDWIMTSSLDALSKERIIKKYTKLNVGYKDAYNGPENSIWRRGYTVWDIPHTLNLGSKAIKNVYY